MGFGTWVGFFFHRPGRTPAVWATRLDPAQGVKPDKLLVETRLRLLLFPRPVAWGTHSENGLGAKRLLAVGSRS